MTVDQVPGLRGNAPQVTSFLADCSIRVATGAVPATTTSSVSVVVHTPGVGPWVAWSSNRRDPFALGEMAAALRDGVRGWGNGDDPNDVALDAWRRRAGRRAERAAAFPWSCETCGQRFKTEAFALAHEAACARRH